LLPSGEKAAGSNGGPELQVFLAKKKMRQLGCRTPWLYLDVPERIIAKFGLR
jgi:hypothetical protein